MRIKNDKNLIKELIIKYKNMKKFNLKKPGSYTPEGYSEWVKKDAELRIQKGKEALRNILLKKGYTLEEIKLKFPSAF